MTRLIARDILLPPRKAAEYLGLERRAYTHLLDTNQIPYEVLGKGKVRRVRKSTLEKFKGQTLRKGVE